MASDPKEAGSASDVSAALPAAASAGSAASKNPEQGSAGFSPAVRTTHPKEILRHNISNEELEMFTRNNRDGLSEAFWACVGGSIAALPAASSALHSSYIADKTESMTVFHLVELLIFVCFLIGGIVIKIIDKKKGSSTDALVAEIRKRKKVETV